MAKTDSCIESAPLAPAAPLLTLPAPHTAPTSPSPAALSQSDVSRISVSKSPGNTLRRRLNNLTAFDRSAGVSEIESELRLQNFDQIRFSTYRCASKLRFIQRKTCLYLIDIWNMIEAFREAGLNQIDSSELMSIHQMHKLIAQTLLQLNKRLSAVQQVDVVKSSQLVISWLLHAYDSGKEEHIPVHSLKVALATLCAGRLVDKLRYIFSQLCDANTGRLIPEKWDVYLRDLLALPTSVLEKPSFGYNEALGQSIFDNPDKVTLNRFIDLLSTAEQDGPKAVSWLPTLHRMATAENVVHPVRCECCKRQRFIGFRYKCQRCNGYNLCQTCFWTGRISGSHKLDHSVNEFAAVGRTKGVGRVIRRTLHCVPSGEETDVLRGVNGESLDGKLGKKTDYLEAIQKPLDLAHVVPPTLPAGQLRTCVSTTNILTSGPTLSTASPTSRLSSSHGILTTTSPLIHSPPTTSAVSPVTNSRTTPLALTSPLLNKAIKSKTGSLDSQRIDDEHRLIARYCARLATSNDTVHMDVTQTTQPSLITRNAQTLDATMSQRQLVAELESKNKEILREIQRLRSEQEMQGSAAYTAGTYPGSSTPLSRRGPVAPPNYPHFTVAPGENPTLMTELRLLRARRDELETRMAGLQESRRELMMQLEGLMKVLKMEQQNVAGSPPRNSPVLRGKQTQQSQQQGSQSSIDNLGSELRQAFSNPSSGGSGTTSMLNGPVSSASATTSTVMNQNQQNSLRNLKNDLLVAADSITHAMSSLVKELNSNEQLDSDHDEEKNITKNALSASNANDNQDFVPLDNPPATDMELTDEIMEQFDARSLPRTKKSASPNQKSNSTSSDTNNTSPIVSVS